jgi:hypothetical protein
VPDKVQGRGVLRRMLDKEIRGRNEPRAVWSDRMPDMPGSMVSHIARSTLGLALAVKPTTFHYRVTCL